MVLLTQNKMDLPCVDPLETGSPEASQTKINSDFCSNNYSSS